MKTGRVLDSMQKLDLKRTEHGLYSAPEGRSIVVDVPDGSFIMLDGHGSPYEGGVFQDAISALYAVAWSLKFAAKKAEPRRDFVVMPLEGLWWWDTEHEWHWTLMIRQPDFVTAKEFAAAIDDARLKTPLAAKVRFERYHEGRAMQTLHVGQYKDEWPTIERLHDDMRRAGQVANGKHHEIYLGDPRRSKPERLKTIIRQPVRPGKEDPA